MVVQIGILKSVYETSVEAIDHQPKRTRSIPLPWEAIIPAKILGTGNPNLVPSNTSPSDPVIHEPIPNLSKTSTTPNTPQLTQPIPEGECSRQRKEKKFLKCLTESLIEVGELRKLSWSGIPDNLRSIVWQILLDYLPAPAQRRVSVLARKRQEYSDAVRLAFGKGLD
ncbi:hypothetical protein DFH28DRAFT_931879 [Melampsora americana]|nr:hypothetical protein DFH28DRAFT_931879 [Melampsora americana]